MNIGPRQRVAAAGGTFFAPRANDTECVAVPKDTGNRNPGPSIYDVRNNSNAKIKIVAVPRQISHLNWIQLPNQSLPQYLVPENATTSFASLVPLRKGSADCIVDFNCGKFDHDYECTCIAQDESQDTCPGSKSYADFDNVSYELEPSTKTNVYKPLLLVLMSTPIFWAFSSPGTCMVLSIVLIAVILLLVGSSTWIHKFR